MARLWDMLKPIDKENLSKVYKNLTGKEFVPPKEGVSCAVNIQEIDEREPGSVA